MRDALVRTVLGDMSADELGPCDYHEHLFQVSALLPGDELADETASGDEAATLPAAGITAVIEATPTALGRRPSAVARISRATGLSIVHVTGAHREEHYPAQHWLPLCTEDDLTARFVADVLDGLPDADADTGERGSLAVGPDHQPVRAGMVKAGAGYWRISTFERRVLTAAARTATTTGVPVMVHLEHGSAAWEVLGVLNRAGLTNDRVVLAHADRNLDPGLHAELTRAGAYLGYDGMARHRGAPDSAILDCLERTLSGGDPSRILLGGDVARRSRYRAYGGLPGLDYLPVRFVPRIQALLGVELTGRLLTENPGRLLALAS